jgi:methionyl-tRNA formyltransferase
MWPVDLVRDAGLASKVRAEEVDLILNVHSLFLINGEVLTSPRIGSFNLHPGPLPEYAGLNAVSWAIYRGERAHAVTLHWMLPRIDAGAIVCKAAFDINEDDTALSLSAKCVRLGIPLILQLLSFSSENPRAIPAIQQDLTKRKYYGKQVPQEGRLRWDSSAREVIDFVRASYYYPFPSPWGHPKARLDGREIGIIKALRTKERSDRTPGTIGQSLREGVRVATGDEWVEVTLVKDGERYLDARELLRPEQQLLDG